MQGNSKYKNSKIIIVSVNPIDDNLAKQHGYEPTNSQVKSFNKKLKKNLKNGIIYCDTYSQIEKNLKTSDGIHYEDSTYKKIYETILKKCL